MGGNGGPDDGVGVVGVGRVGRHRGKLSLAVGVIVLGVGVGVTAEHWEWLGGTEDDGESPSTTVRNVGLLVGGGIALWIAVWRSRIAERQADTAQQDLRNKRYQESAAMLGSDVLAVRFAGIYALQRLAEEHPEGYHTQIMRLLAAFVRHPTTGPTGTAIGGGRADVELAIRVASACRDKQMGTHLACGLDLHGADLSGVALIAVNLSSAQVPDRLLAMDPHRLPPQEVVEDVFVDLSLAKLRRSDLRNAKLRRAVMMGTDVTDAALDGADLSGVRFSGQLFTKGLTQEQLDSAIADPDEEPNLQGARDAKTGKRLVWRGNTLDGKPHPNPPQIPDD